MTDAIYLLLFIVSLCFVSYLHNKRKIEAQRRRDKSFELLMRALEDKAKKEGTFKVSYFD